MISIFIRYPTSKKEVPHGIGTVMYYNYDKNEMEFYEGSRLEMYTVYDEDSGEWVQRARGVKDSHFEDIVSKDKVERWFNQYQNYNETQAQIVSSDNQGVVFELPDKEEDDFIDSLTRAGLSYEIR